ncbi:10113_t:CDS:10 [Paraglomus occultum]|uniref:10113_t:CDS:1 n=1 Tax=Paraglomus occultum TaxID=144539 RepID=A0A9N8ZTU6_9GLOM|nr:10113_t:CDS:10 [Paraglomus occultum]
MIKRFSDDKDVRVVVGIDFGTTFSGFSYGHVDRPREVEVYNLWPHGSISKSIGWKIPTVLAYTEDLKVAHIGNEVSIAEGPIDNCDEGRYYFVDRFKMSLFNVEDADKPSLVGGIKPKKAIKDYLIYMKNHIKAHIDRRWPDVDYPKQVYFVFTLPIGWKQEQKNFMLRRAIKAGLFDADCKENVAFIDEPEAAAIDCFPLMDKHGLKSGEKFMIVDCGGGTVDLTTRKLLANKKIDEHTESSFNRWGGITVDNEFVKVLADKLGIEREKMEELRKTYYGEFIGLIENRFGPIKSEFLGKEELYTDQKVQITETYEFLKEEVKDTDTRKELEDKGWILVFTYADVHAMFEPSIKGILKSINKQLEAAGSCSAIFLVGGYSSSPHLIQRVKNKFKGQVEIIDRPSNPVTAVVRGSALYGLSIDHDVNSDAYGASKVIESRVLRYTYGTDMEVRRADSNRKVLKFSRLARRGDSVKQDQKVRQIYCPSHPRQTKMSLSIYASKDYNPEYIESASVRKIQDWTIDLPDRYLGRNRPVELSLEFGNFETTITARSKVTGELLKTIEDSDWMNETLDS